MFAGKDISVHALLEYGYISRRTCNALLKNGLKTLGDILNYIKGNEQRLLQLDSFGRKAFTEISSLLKNNSIEESKTLDADSPQAEKETTIEIYKLTTIQDLYDRRLISFRSLNALLHSGINTVGDLISYINNTPTGGLLNIRNLGEKSKEEIIDAINFVKQHQTDYLDFCSKEINKIYNEVFCGDYEVDHFVRRLFPNCENLINTFINDNRYCLKIYGDLQRDGNLQLRKRYLYFVNRVLSFLLSNNLTFVTLYELFSNIRNILINNIDHFSLEDEITYFLSPVQRIAIENCFKKLCAQLSPRANRVQKEVFPSYIECVSYFHERNLESLEALLLRIFTSKNSKTVQEIIEFVYSYRRYVTLFIDSDIKSQEWLYKDEFPFLANDEIEFMNNYMKNHNSYPLIHILYIYLRNTDNRNEKIYCYYKGLLDGCTHTLKQTANYFGIARERARQVLAKNPLIDSPILEYNDWKNYKDLFSVPFITESSPQFRMIREEEELTFGFDIFAIIIPLVAAYKDYCILNNHFLVNNSLIDVLGVDKIIKEIETIINGKYTRDTSFNLTDFIRDVPDYYKNDALLLYTHIISNIYGKSVKEDVFVMAQNKLDVSLEVYKILSQNGKPMHIDEIFEAFNNLYPNHKYKDPNSLRRVLLKNAHVISIKNTSTYALDSWNVFAGGVRDRIKELLVESSTPMRVDDITHLVLDVIPRSNKRSISSTMSGMLSMNVLVKFENNLWGLSSKEYSPIYKLERETPDLSFDERMRDFENFVVTYQRFPFSSGSEYEESISRWYRNIKAGLLDITKEQHQKLENMIFNFRLKNYPQTSIEYKFREKCKDYKDYIDAYHKIPTRKDNQLLYDWMKKVSSDYNSYTDNRRYYLDELLQYISSQELKEASKQQDTHTNLFSNNLDEIYKNYICQFQKIRQANVNGSVIKAKPILLLAVIDGINEGRVVNNCIVMNEWLEIHYTTLMYRYSTNYADMTEINMPFWHLKNDGFWHLQFAGEKVERTSTPTMNWIRENVHFAYFDEPLWILLENQEWRMKLRNFIIEHKLTN